MTDYPTLPDLTLPNVGDMPRPVMTVDGSPLTDQRDALIVRTKFVRQAAHERRKEEDAARRDGRELPDLHAERIQNARAHLEEIETRKLVGDATEADVQEARRVLDELQRGVVPGSPAAINRMDRALGETKAK